MESRQNAGLGSFYSRAILLVIFLSASQFLLNLAGQDVLEKVDLFIGTSGDHGQLDPSATVPFGMIKVGADTYPGNHSGYNYLASEIRGFSHNRIGGVGCSGAGGSLRILPGIGDGKSLSEAFTKDSEKASPGHYAVTFENAIAVELTAMNNAAFHRYTFPKSDSSFIRFNLESSFARFINATMTPIAENEFTVTVSAMNVCDFGRFTTHFHVKCNKKPFDSVNIDGQLIYFFKTNENEAIELTVTASTISQADARDEHLAVSSIYTFDQVRDEAAKKWLKLLSKIEVTGKEEYEKLFYTHLYHVFLNPVKTENRENRFRGTDGQIYTANNYIHYDSWSMWDNFRNKFSLYSIILPEVSEDICHSLTDLFKYGKPFWSSYSEPVPTVRTEHSIVTLLDLYRRGITGFSPEIAYNRMCAEIDNIAAKTPDTKLEKSYDYWAMSEFAKILNRPEDQKLFLAKAHRYKATWEKYFAVIDDQADIMHAKGLYEGTIWQYRWHVQQDIEGLIDLFGGEDYYTEQLELFFDNHLYNHGNQPDIHVPFMFNYSTKPWLTQKWVNRILTKEMYQFYGTHKKWDEPYIGRIYKAEPEGYIPEMDDDDGTMSAWYVLSSMGLYPVEVGKPVFQLTSPIFDRVVFHLPNGKTFEIQAKDLDSDSFYIQSITLNGERHTKLQIDQKDIMGGGKLVYQLQRIPVASY